MEIWLSDSVIVMVYTVTGQGLEMTWRNGGAGLRQPKWPWMLSWNHSPRNDVVAAPGVRYWSDDIRLWIYKSRWKWQLVSGHCTNNKSPQRSLCQNELIVNLYQYTIDSSFTYYFDKLKGECSFDGQSRAGLSNSSSGGCFIRVWVQSWSRHIIVLGQDT